MLIKTKRRQLLTPVITAAATAAVLTVFMLTVIDSGGVFTAARNGIYACFDVIIPALFAPVVVSSLLLSTGVYKICTAPLYLLLRRVLPFTREQFGVFILSLTGGYPVGVNLIQQSRAQSDSAARPLPSALSACCYCPSPAFVIAVTEELYGNAEIGAIIYISNALACVTVALFVSRFINKSTTAEVAETVAPPVKYGECLVNSVYAARCFGVICLSVVAFNIAIELMRFTGIIQDGAIGAVTAAFVEISNIGGIAPHLNSVPPCIIAALLSFGGACVIFQICSLGHGLNLSAFASARPVSAVLSAVYCFAIVGITGGVFDGRTGNAAASAAAAVGHSLSAGEHLAEISPNASASVILMIMTAMLLHSIGKRSVTEITASAPETVPADAASQRLRKTATSAVSG